MAARTLETGYFGSVGMSDPMSSFNERTFGVAWNFKKKPVTQNLKKDDTHEGDPKVIPLMELPKGFCVDRISVVQTKELNAAVTLTFGLASDDAKLLGGNFALVNTGTLLRSSQDPDATNKTASFIDSGDVLCMVVPPSSSTTVATTFNDGAFDLCIHGFETFAEGDTGNALQRKNYRDSLQTQDNISGGQWPLD